MRRVFAGALAVAMAVTVGSSTWGAADGTSAIAPATSASAPTQMAGTKIRIRVGARTLTATVAPNATARDFVSRLPLSRRMRDVLAREKSAALPRALARGGSPRYTFAAGDIAYQPRSRNLVVYYRRSADIPQPGLVLLARLDSNARPFNVPGTVRVRIERVRTTQPTSSPPRAVVGSIVRFSSSRTSVDVTIDQNNPQSATSSRCSP